MNYDDPTLHEALAARIAERNALDNLLNGIEHALGCEREELLQTVNTVLTEREEALEILEALEVAFTCERKDLLASVKEFIGDSMKLIDRCATAEAALDKINKAFAEAVKDGLRQHMSLGYDLPPYKSGKTMFFGSYSPPTPAEGQTVAEYAASLNTPESPVIAFVATSEHGATSAEPVSLDELDRAMADKRKAAIDTFNAGLRQHESPSGRLIFSSKMSLDELDRIMADGSPPVGSLHEDDVVFTAEVPGFDGTPDSPPIGPTVRPPGLAGASLAADFMAGKLGLVIRSGNTARFVELED